MLKSILALDFPDQIVHLKDFKDAAFSAAVLTYSALQKASASIEVVFVNGRAEIHFRLI